MAIRTYDPIRDEIEKREEEEAYARAEAEQQAEREHEYRLAKLKYSTAGKWRTWARVLVAFAKAPAWIVLAFRCKSDLPAHWQKFLDI